MKGFKTADQRKPPKDEPAQQGPVLQGPVQGPGTGTSDSIKGVVPEGSFVMPADSSQAMGGMSPAGPQGFRPSGLIPVHVSNGENVIPPEQVHAVGAQVLNGMRAATHSPVEQPQQSNNDLYFANGGLVTDPEKRQLPPLATSPSNTYPGNQAEAAGNIYAQGNADIARGWRYLNQGDPVKDAIRGIGQFMSNSAEQARQPNTWDESGTRLQYPEAPAQKAVAPASTQIVLPNPPQSKAQAPANSTYGNEPNSPAAPATAPLANNVTRVGNSYSGKDIGMGFTINGKEPGGGFAVVPPFHSPSQDSSGAAGFQAGGPKVGVIGDPAGSADRQAVMAAAMTPFSGSPNRQLTANQLRVAQGMLDTETRDATARYQTDTQAATQAGTVQAQQAGENLRNAEREAGANARAAASNQIQQGDLSLRQQAQGFQSRQQGRLESLYLAYEKAAPEDRGSIAEQIRVLSGKDAPNRFTVVPGGQVIDPESKMPYTQPSAVLNNQTGEFLSQPKRPVEALDLPSNNSALIQGQIYKTARGNARWNGKQFDPVQ